MHIDVRFKSGFTSFPSSKGLFSSFSFSLSSNSTTLLSPPKIKKIPRLKGFVYMYGTTKNYILQHTWILVTQKTKKDHNSGRLKPTLSNPTKTSFMLLISHLLFQPITTSSSFKVILDTKIGQIVNILMSTYQGRQSSNFQRNREQMLHSSFLRGHKQEKRLGSTRTESDSQQNYQLVRIAYAIPSVAKECFSKIMSDQFILNFFFQEKQCQVYRELT